MTDWLEEHGIFVAGVISDRFDVAWLIRMFQEVALRINRLSGFAILAFVFLMMLLLEVKEFSRKLGSLKDVGPKLLEASGETAALIRRYMLVRTLLSIITGLAVWGFALLMGVEPASAWGLLAFTLNYIPFLGSFVDGVTGMLSPGSYGHGGLYGTQGWIDPVKKRIFVLMYQRAGLPNSDASDIRRDFQQAAVEEFEKTR